MQTLAPRPLRPAYLRATSSHDEGRRYLTVPSPTPSRAASPTPSEAPSRTSTHSLVAQWPPRPCSPCPPQEPWLPLNLPRRISPTPAPSELPYLAAPPAPLLPLHVVEPEGSDRRTRIGAALLRLLMVLSGMAFPVGMLWWGLSRRSGD